MTTGTVKWFAPEKGYGFIQPDDGTRDVFVHASTVRRAGLDALLPGQSVEFVATMDCKTGKVSAASVQVVA